MSTVKKLNELEIYTNNVIVPDIYVRESGVLEVNEPFTVFKKDALVRNIILGA